MALLSVQALGIPAIHLDGQPRPIPLRKGIALLVYLAESKGAVGRDAAATLLWPESSADIGRARLRRLLHRLQRSVGAELLSADRSTIRWSPTVDLDLDTLQFEMACDRGQFDFACRLYQGDFLQDFSLGDSREFDDWAFFRREALRGRMIQALERIVTERHALGDFVSAAAHAARLVEFDPFSDAYHRHLIRNLLLTGDRVTAGRHLEAFTLRLRDELDITPEPETIALLSAATVAPGDDDRTTRYAGGGPVHLAYQTVGDGPIDILVLLGFVSHVERIWEEPSCRAFLSSLAKMGRLILFDRRGIGLSDRLGFNPGVDATAQDIEAVLDATQSRRVVLFGASEGGPACIRFAADHPERVAGLVLFASLAKGSAAADYPHALTSAQYATWLGQLVSGWGGPAGIEVFAPSLSSEAQAKAWWAGLLRAASSPGAIRGVLEALRDTDVRSHLGRISIPTLVMHRRGDQAVRIGAGRHLADGIAGSEFVELEGSDHWPFAGDQRTLLRRVQQFVGDLKV